MLQLVERDFFRPTEIKLSAVKPGGHSLAPTHPTRVDVSPEVQVLRVGKFNHPKYGEFEITTQTLAELKDNFDKKVRGVDIAVDYFHKSDEEAAGWIDELYLSEDGNELWARVTWTAEATQKLTEREIRYFSPDFAFQWTDPETNKTYRNVLFGGGLTNRPFVKDMAAIVASEENKGEIMNEKELKELQEKVLKLSEENEAMKKAHGEMQKKMEEMAEKPAVKCEDPEAEKEPDEDDVPALKAKLAEMGKKLAEYEEKFKKAEEAKQMAEKEAKFNILLTEGKACVAQKDAYMKGDMNEFIKLSQPLNLEGKGTAETPKSDAGDREDRVIKLAEEKVKADPKLSMIEAISQANKEVK